MTPDGKKVAVTAGCMDRAENLARSLATWVALPEADHVVVVDWSSREPLRRLTQVSPRVTVARVSGQQFWRNSLCHNLEIRLAAELGCDLVLRVDSDTLVRSDFFALHPAHASRFYAVDCHQVPASVDDKRNLCGVVYAHLSHLLAVNGYNERLCRYGYEDEDLYERLTKSGLTWKKCVLDTLDHIPHSDAARLARLDLRGIPGKVVTQGPRKMAVHCVEQSRDLAESKPWGPSDRRTPWKITKESTNYWEANPT